MTILETQIDGSGVPTVATQLQTGSIVPSFPVAGPIFLGPPAQAPPVGDGPFGLVPLDTPGLGSGGGIVQATAGTQLAMAEPSPLATSNTSASVPAGVPVSQASTSTAISPTVGLSTTGIGNFASTLGSDAVDIVTNPTKHLVAIAVILFVGWWFFFRRKRR